LVANPGFNVFSSLLAFLSENFVYITPIHLIFRVCFLKAPAPKANLA
jgi:hypothetical protein